jgi:hypothetical protein
MDRLGRVEVTYDRRRKEACQRALVADQQAIIERVEAFVYQLQADLARCAGKVAVGNPIMVSSSKIPGKVAVGNPIMVRVRR